MEALEPIYILAAILVVIVTALVELVKLTFPKMPRNFVPILAFVLGIAIACIYPFTELPMLHRAWAGAFAGLAATGLFELAFNPRPGQVKDSK